MSETEFSCTICDKTYKSYQSYWNHNKLYHAELNIKISKKERNFTCISCQKKFTRKDSLMKHVNNSCKIKISQNNEITELKKQVAELQKLVLENKPITKKNTSNTNNGTINNGTINNTINNTIYINKTGTENLLELNEKEVNEIFNNNISGLISLVKFINFNERLPANHSFCAKSLEGKYLLVYNTDESKIESTRKKYFYQDLLTSAINKMDNLYTNNKSKLNKEKQKKIETTLMTLKNLNLRKLSDKLLIEMKNKLVELSYNCRETVLKTWDNNDLKSVETDDAYSECFCDIVNDTIEICDKAKDGLESDSDSDSESTPKLIIRKSVPKKELVKKEPSSESLSDSEIEV